MKKVIIWVVILVIIIGLVVVIINKNKKSSVVQNVISGTQEKSKSIFDDQSQVKEFQMTSFVEMVDGKPKPQYSLKEITVNKGDKVRIKITVTSGMHDFKIDEYGVYADTQLNKESIIEFTADKAGEFIYYCTKPGHRANGHWGTLKVI